MVETVEELRRVQRELEAVLGRLACGFSSDDRDQYVRLLARQELLLIELARVRGGDPGWRRVGAGWN